MHEIDLEAFKKLFRSSTKDGKLNNCQELTPDGKKFAVWLLHLLESQSDVTDGPIINKIKTWNYFEKRRDIFKISKATVLQILAGWKTDPADGEKLDKAMKIPTDDHNDTTDTSEPNDNSNKPENMNIHEDQESDEFETNDVDPNETNVINSNEPFDMKILTDKKNDAPKPKESKLSEDSKIHVRNQCGNHSIGVLSKLLNVPKSSLHYWVKKKNTDMVCHFCKISKEEDDLEALVQKVFTPGKKDLTNELKELVRSQCGNHSMVKMSTIMKVPKTTLYEWIKRENLYPFEKITNLECHFCKVEKNDQNSKESPKNLAKSVAITITQSAQEFVKNQCGEHSTSEISLHLNIPKSTLQKWVTSSGIYPYVKKHDTNCHFCCLETPEKEPALPLKVQKIVKSQCGNHSVNSMAKILGKCNSTLHKWITRERIMFTMESDNCHFCINHEQKKRKLELSTDDIPAMDTPGYN